MRRLRCLRGRAEIDFLGPLLLPVNANSPQWCPSSRNFKQGPLEQLAAFPQSCNAHICSFRGMIQLWRSSALAVFLCWLQLALGDSQAVLAENAKLSNETLLWGPYRPNLYFGVRPRIPKSLITGLLWAKVDSFTEVQNSMQQLPAASVTQRRG